MVVETTSITLFGDKRAPHAHGNTVIIFGVTRGGTTMVAGALRGFGYHLGSGLLVNLEDDDFWYKSDDHMRETIKTRDAAHPLWGWKFPLAAEYLDRILPSVRNPMLVIVGRDPIATATALVRWDESRQPSGAIADAMLQMQKNLVLALRWQLPTLFVSYEKTGLDPDLFLTELGIFLDLPLVVDRARLLKFMAPGSYKSYDEVVLGPRLDREACGPDHPPDGSEGAAVI